MVFGGCLNIADIHIPDIRDSKAVKVEKRRKALCAAIEDQLLCATVFIPSAIINAKGHAWAVQNGPWAVCHQLMAVAARAGIDGAECDVVFDGNMQDDEHIDYGGVRFNIRSEVKADANVFECSAASIVAKVSRDNWIADLVSNTDAYADYGVGSNKGYGTVHHADALIEHGLTDRHRQGAASTLMHNRKAKLDKTR